LVSCLKADQNVLLPGENGEIRVERPTDHPNAQQGDERPRVGAFITLQNAHMKAADINV
jgi:hypothetical protein